MTGWYPGRVRRGETIQGCRQVPEGPGGRPVLTQVRLRQARSARGRRGQGLVIWYCVTPAFTGVKVLERLSRSKGSEAPLNRS